MSGFSLSEAPAQGDLPQTLSSVSVEGMSPSVPYHSLRQHASDRVLFRSHLPLSSRFILLAPKDKDHYNPIMDLEKSLYTIVECEMIS